MARRRAKNPLNGFDTSRNYGLNELCEALGPRAQAIYKVWQTGRLEYDAEGRVTGDSFAQAYRELFEKGALSPEDGIAVKPRPRRKTSPPAATRKRSASATKRARKGALLPGDIPLEGESLGDGPSLEPYGDQDPPLDDIPPPRSPPRRRRRKKPPKDDEKPKKGGSPYGDPLDGKYDAYRHLISGDD